ncbi:hypothetical protein [Nocardia lijiangensis]|uniref:hypothetical protein n=1 Tax=Nocardia lijiangensis TaxID=299618 RepID=UPI000AE30BAC|nr:hypothetical protein [Nocardia lijiangensis]
MTGTVLFRSPVSPRSVALAAAGFVVALLAGIGEALARAAMTLDRSEADVPDLAAGLAVRCAIYLVVFAVVVRMTRGDRMARLALALGLGILGLASLLVEPLTALATEGFDLSVTPSSLTLGILRAIHVLAVLVAIPAMYTPDARTYFARGATA